MGDNSFDFGVNIDVSDLFHKTQAIRNAIEMSAKQAFFASPTISEQFAQVGGQLRPMEYARPSFVRVMDPTQGQRESTIRNAFSMLPPALYTPENVDPRIYREEYRTQVLERTLTAGAIGGGMFGAQALLWTKGLSSLTKFAPSIFGKLGLSGAATVAGRAYDLAGGSFGLGSLLAGGLGGAAGLALGLGVPLAASYAIGKTADIFIEDIQADAAARNIGLQAISQTYSTSNLGVGFTRTQTKRFANWMQDVAEKSRIKTPTMFGIAEFAATTGQFTGARDVEDVKNKIMATLSTLSDIAEESNASLEEVMGYARDIGQMGFAFGTPETSRFIKDVSRAGRWANMPGRQMLGMTRMGAEMFRGTGIATQYGALAMTQALPAISQMSELGIISPYLMSQLGGTSADLARTSLIRQQQFALSMPATVMTAGLGMLGPGALSQFNAGSIGIGQVLGAAGAVGGSVERAAYFMMNQGKMFSQMDPMQVTQMQGQMVNQMIGQMGLRRTPEMFQYAAMGLFPGQFRSPMEAELFYKEFTYAPSIRVAQEGKDAINEVRAEVARRSTLGYRMGFTDPEGWWSKFTKGVKYVPLGLTSSFRDAVESIRSIPGIFRRPDLAISGGEYTRLQRLLEVETEERSVKAEYFPDISTAAKLLETPGVEAAIRYYHSEKKLAGVQAYISPATGAGREARETALGLEKILGLTDKSSSGGIAAKDITAARKKKEGLEKQLYKIGVNMLPGMQAASSEEAKEYYSYIAIGGALTRKANSEADPVRKKELQQEAWKYLGKARDLFPNKFDKNLGEKGFNFASDYGQYLGDETNNTLNQYVGAVAAEEKLVSQESFRRWAFGREDMDSGVYAIIQGTLGGQEFTEEQYRKALEKASPVEVTLIRAAIKAKPGMRAEAIRGSWTGEVLPALEEKIEGKAPHTTINVEKMELDLGDDIARAIAKKTLNVKLDETSLNALRG